MNLIKDSLINNNLTPIKFFLSQNYPNPFGGKTSIKYCIAFRTRVLLQLFNIYGELIEALIDEEKATGTYEFEFDPVQYRALSGDKLREGNYICQLKAGDYLGQIEMTYSSKNIHSHILR